MRLEQRDSYLQEFESRVAAFETRSGALWLRLDDSLFYPASGGQPHDTGHLEATGGRAEVDEVALDGNEVWHRIRREGGGGGPSFVVGERVHGVIDWPRRLRHMQRHSAQHLLSQAFVRIDPRFETRSVGLRSPPCTLDLAGEPDDEQSERAERLANDVAWRNLPIEAFEIDEADLGAYPLRRPPKVTGSIRLVRMGDFELSACGGTHLRATAEAAPIKIVGRERIRGGLIRISFLAGREALDDYRGKHEVAAGLAAAFSSRVEELPERVAALQAELAETRRLLAAERERAVAALAARLRAGAETTPLGWLVVHELADAGDDPLPLARALVEPGGTVALLAAVDGGRARLLFTCSDDVELDVRPLLTRALAELGGRGGGRERLAQGAGDPDGLTVALQRAAAAIRTANHG